ncbi:Asp23/Gls24 family envelope stress response protein [Microbacterium sp. Se5.02b]|uniref:Asp23/Gls24 family envelope stress response protein n=1 Tax=Microbacterium sp. Se5.02b TaxID=2864103 RepID=UPI001C68B2A5|nr:Asp23/Gls24 family envelope stress response protein [Microbacterium sp. Se5.02b]QYM65199.1 Asp23/Gls24 family envelope stress response protein [Microbacterium sp. Se5.02b]
MTDERETPDVRRLGLEPTDLDGHTLDELTDYLDAGRQPADRSIDESPGCQLALDALERLHGLGAELIAAEAAAEREVDQGWVDRILSGIAMDARAGRRIRFDSPDPTADLGITEGAIRGLIRSAERAVPGLLIGRCRLDGDLTEPGAPVRVTIDASALHGQPIPLIAEQLRAEVDRDLRAHTPLNVVAIDIAIRDIREVSSWTQES